MLIKTIDEIRAHKLFPVPASNSTEFMPTFERAEMDYLLPILGETLYNELQTAYDTDSMSNDQQALLAYCQKAIIPFGYIDALPLKQVNITDMGLVSMDTENVRKPFKWELNNAIEALSIIGYAQLESLIIFLRANSADFVLWADSPYNDSKNCALIRDGKDLALVSALKQPHRCFMLLRSVIDEAAEEFIKKNIGLEFYEDLNSKIIADNLSTQEKIVVDYLRRALVKMTMAKAVKDMNVQYDGTRFTIADKLVKDSKYEGSANATQEQVNALSDEMERSANTYMITAVNYLNANASSIVFAEYYNSDLYTDPAENNTTPDNSNYKGIFRIS